MKKTVKYISGNTAAAIAAKLIRAQVIPAYPITPATTIPEKISEFCADGSCSADLMLVESEHSAMAACFGASMEGARTFTATSSQGLLLMNEMIHWVAGARRPVGLVNVNRAICAPWALWADHNDSMSVKDAGWMQFYCKNAQELLDTIIIGYRIAEELMIPVHVAAEGFLVSHTYEPVIIPAQEDIDRFLPPFDPADKLDSENPHSFGNLMTADAYTETRYNLHEDILKAPALCRKYAKLYRKITGQKTEMIMETVNTRKAKTIVISMGTIASTVEEVIKSDSLPSAIKGNNNFGSIRLKMFRPFPGKMLANQLENCDRVIVIDRNISPGQGGHLWQETRHALYNHCRRRIPVFGYITGLNGQDVTPEVVKNIIKNSQRRIYDAKPIPWRKK